MPTQVIREDETPKPCQICGEHKRPWDLAKCADCGKLVCCACGPSYTIYEANRCWMCRNKREVAKMRRRGAMA